MTVDETVRTDDRPVAPTTPERTASEELIIKEAKRRHRRRLAAVVGIVVLVVGGVAIAVITIRGQSSSPVPSSARPVVRPGPSPTGPPVCQSGQILVSSLGGGAGAGNVDQVFGFTNTSSTTCSLSGYPRVAALNANGLQVAIAEQQLSYVNGVPQGPLKAPAVTMSPGQVSSALVSGDDIPVGNATVCPAGYPAFLITPPGATTSVRVAAVDGAGPGPFPGCSTLIRVSPIVPGASGSAR
jgi:hypothetical protein